MTEDQFWSIVERARERANDNWQPGRDVLEDQADHLREEMRSLDPFIIIVFDTWWKTLAVRPRRRDVRAAFLWMTGGVGSDDTFFDFCQCLVCLGRDVLNKVVQDPDNLVELVERWDVDVRSFADDIGGIPVTAYAEATGADDIPEEVRLRAANHVGRQTGGIPMSSNEPATDDTVDWSDLVEMRKRFPRLVARLPGIGDSR